VTNFFRLAEFERPQYGNRCVANVAVEVPQLPPIALVVEHFEQLARLDRELLVVVGRAIVDHLIDLGASVDQVDRPLLHLLVVADVDLRLLLTAAALLVMEGFTAVAVVTMAVQRMVQ